MIKLLKKENVVDQDQSQHHIIQVIPIIHIEMHQKSNENMRVVDIDAHIVRVVNQKQDDIVRPQVQLQRLHHLLQQIVKRSKRLVVMMISIK